MKKVKESKRQQKKTKYEPPKRTPVDRCQPDKDQGLTAEQVKNYLQNGWGNEPVESATKSIEEIIKGNLFTYFNLIFAVLSLLVIIAGSFRSLTFLPVVIANLFIGIIQEIRAKSVLDRLSVLNVPKVTAIREGKRMEIPTEKLVLDDIVLFHAGNQICADAIVMDGEVSVNEALLTGESDEILKKPGDKLMSGSFIVSGKCRARLDKVGQDSYISNLTLEAKAMEQKEQSEMLRVLDKLVGVVGILIIPIGILLFAQQFFILKTPFQDSIISMVAAVIGMIPEGLYLLTSVALVVSVIRLASKKVLVHDMKCIETLARVDVLCVDKTGTITENDMKVTGVIPMGKDNSLEITEINTMLSDFVVPMANDNITMVAMKQHFHTSSGKTPSSVTPFSSKYKYSAVVYEKDSYVLGAPEYVLKEDYSEYKDKVESHSNTGDRVLIFGKYQGVLDGKELKEPVCPIAMVLFANPVRKEANATFSYFKDQGVDIKVISGDNPLTVSKVAKEAGIANAEHYVDATSLRSEKEIQEALKHSTVFGRVTPEQKRQFVKALKVEGHTVGMTGDGVNDILALKDADCSIAMASGCDAAAQVSQLVLLESDFSCMPSVVGEGRRVVNNIERSASLFLVKNIFSFLMAVFAVCFKVNYPLEPSQISLISTFTIGIPAFFLALQPNVNKIQGHFLPNVLMKALPAGVTDFLAVGALVMFGQTFQVNASDISTACTMLLAIVGFMILYHISKPMNILRWGILIGCILALLVCSVYLGDLFAIEKMSKSCVMLFVVFAIATEPVLRYGTMLMEKSRTLINKIKNKKKISRS